MTNRQRLFHLGLAAHVVWHSRWRHFFIAMLLLALAWFVAGVAEGEAAAGAKVTQPMLEAVCGKIDVQCQEAVRHALETGEPMHAPLPTLITTGMPFVMDDPGNVIIPGSDPVQTWRFIDELAFSMYTLRISEWHPKQLTEANYKREMRNSYAAAKAFLHHMNEIRKPYVE